MKRSRMIGAAVLVLLAADGLWAATATAAASRPTASSATASSASGTSATSTAAPTGLARYFGFGDMEILKLENGLGRPQIVDLNHDGLNDIVVINNAKSRIEFLLQRKNFKPSDKVKVSTNPDDINDLFGKETSWRFKRVGYDLEVGAASLEVVDLNGDGLPDLVYYGRGALYIVLQQPPAKDAAAKDADAGPRGPAWQPAKKIEIPDGLTAEGALAVGDLNGHGRMDITLLANDGVFILYQKADGSYGQPVRYPSAGRRLRRAYIADVDGDGRNDLVLLTGEEPFPVRVRFQAADGTLGPEVRYDMPMPAVMEMISLGQSKQKVFATIAAGSGRVQLHALSPATEKAAWPVLHYPLPVTENAGDRDTVAADLAGSGRLDVVASDPSTAEFLVFRSRAGDVLASPERFPGMMDMRKLCAGDLDKSGRAAIVALSIKEKLVGVSRFADGRLSFPKSLPVVGEPEAMDLADVDGDGTLDLVYIAKDADPAGKGPAQRFLRTLLNIGAKESKTGPELELPDLKDRPLDIRAADVDHDGRCDVMIINAFGPITLVRQGEAGKFAVVGGKDFHAALVSDVAPSALSLAPLGPKGQTAVLLAQKTFARSLVFDADKGWTVVDQYPPADPRSKLTAAGAFPLGKDGAVEVVAYDAVRGKLGILSRQADGTYRTDQEVDLGQMDVKKILGGNFGGTSPMSLLVCGAQQIALVPTVSTSKVLRKLAGYETPLPSAMFGALAVGDLNNSGKPSIALADQATGHVEILTFNGQAELVTATRFRVFEQPREIESGRSRPSGMRESADEPRAVLIGDVTGDGKADLVLLVHDRIIIYPQN
jgi:hypothetical protein